MAAGIPARLTPREGRRFGLVVGAAFLALAALLGWRGAAVAWRVASGLGVALALAGALVPGRLGPVYRAWMGLALVISKVTTPILMAVIYYLLVTPIGVVMRLAGRRALARRPEAGSYWVAAPSGGRSDLERQF